MQSQITSIGTFVGGLNTEQPQLADQIQYTTDELNCQLLPDGTRARRYGLTREENSTGLPMTYKEDEEISSMWIAKSAEYLNGLTDDQYLEFTLVCDFYDNQPGLATNAEADTYITDGANGIKKFAMGTDQNAWIVLKFFSNADPTAYASINFWNLLFKKPDETPIADPTGRELKIRIKRDPAIDWFEYEIFDEDGISYGSLNALAPVQNYKFLEYIREENTEGMLKNLLDQDVFGWHFKDIKIVLSDEESISPVADEEKESYNVKHTEPGEYTLNITTPGIYTVWMSGGGAKEAILKSSRKFSYGYIYRLIHGSGGGGIKFYGYFPEGEYTVKVGVSGADRSGKQDLPGHGYFRWYSGTETSIKGPTVDISAGGGSSRAFWAKEAREYVDYKGYVSKVGDVNISEAPVSFSVASRTTDGTFTPNSFLTNDIEGPGAINKSGFFRITKGIVLGNGIDEGEDATVVIDNGKINAYYWANYDKAGADCIVLQVGSSLKFFEATRPYDGELIAEIVSTESYIKDEKFGRYQFSSGEGYLLCVSEYSQPFYVTLDKEHNTATPTGITLQIRDLFGVEDFLLVDEQPATLTDKHKYNLLNQGWDETKINTYQSNRHVYPSNALIWWFGKDGNGDFSANLLTKQYFGTTPAPKGHYILEYFNQDRANVSGISGLEKIEKNRYCCSSEFFAGRFFYLTSSTVLFSQIVREDIRGIGKCYQEADPTSQTISDIIATDGGQIIFQDLGYGKKIKKFPLGLLVFGSKSVYAITSTASNAFNATQYLTQFVTNAGCIGGGSVVGAEDVVYYWSPQGIYQIVVDQISGTQAVAASVSSDTIQQWYNNLPNFSKENCIGAYDYTNRRIVWTYPTDENNLENRDGILVYYLDFKAFLPSKISKGGNLITVFETIIPTYLVPSISLFAGDDEVGADNNDVIVKDFGQEYGRNFSVCYLGYIESYDKLFFCDFYSRDFIDWQTNSYKSYAVSYPITFGSTWQKQYTPTLQCYYLRTEEDIMRNGQYLAPSSCYLSARWRWGETEDSDRWDLKQESYIHIPRFMEFKYVNGKIRVRGSGPAVQYKIESNEDSDFKLSGMNMLIRTV